MSKIKLFAFILLITPFTTMAQTDTQPPEVSLEGLELVEKNRRGELYADPGIDWNTYEKIQLDAATVAFRKNWKRDQNRYEFNKIRDSDMERMKTDLSSLFGEAFGQKLTEEGGYELSEQAADNVMRIEPHIVDLDVYAPDSRSTVGITRSYTETAGRMTLKLHIYDSVTGDLIATASDRQEAPRKGYMQWTTSVTNNAEARRMIQRWATALLKRLEDAKAGKSD